MTTVFYGGGQGGNNVFQPAPLSIMIAVRRISLLFQAMTRSVKIIRGSTKVDLESNEKI